MSWKETDPISLWKTATVVPLVATTDDAAKDEAMKDKTPVGMRLHGKRSYLWTSLLEMPAERRQAYLHRLVQNWPYDTERRALNWPMHLLSATACLSSGFIAARVNADLFLLNPKIRLLDSIRKCPFVPFGMAVYTTGISTYAMHRFFVYKPLVESEDHPEPLRLFVTIAAIQLGAAVLLPTLTVPHLSYFVKLYQEPHHYKSKSYIDSMTLSYEFSRSVWRHIPAMAAMQVLIAGLAAYSFYWARKRIYTTVNVDPEYIREVMGNLEGKRGKLATKLLGNYHKLKETTYDAFPPGPTSIK